MEFKNNLCKTNKKIRYFFIVLIFLLIFILFIFNSSNGSLSFPTNSKIIEIKIIEIFKVLIVGWSIGLSNYCLQYITKNKFSDIGIFGTYSILQLVTMVIIFLIGEKFVQQDQKIIVSIIYTFFGLLSGIIFYFLTLKTNLASKKVLIYGLFLNTVVTSLISILLFSINLDVDTVNKNYNIYLTKLLGYIDGWGGYESLLFQSFILLFSSIYIFVNKFKISCLYLDDKKIKSMGLDLRNFRFFIIIIISLIATVTYAIVGYIAFIGIAINFIVNRFFKGINFQLEMSIFLTIFVALLCQILFKIFVYYLPINNKALPLSAFFGIISFPIFCYAIIYKN